jgi:hypothetical protein
MWGTASLASTEDVVSQAAATTSLLYWRIALYRICFDWATVSA